MVKVFRLTLQNNVTSEPLSVLEKRRLRMAKRQEKRQKEMEIKKQQRAKKKIQTEKTLNSKKTTEVLKKSNSLHQEHSLQLQDLEQALNYGLTDKALNSHFSSDFVKRVKIGDLKEKWIMQQNRMIHSTNNTREFQIPQSDSFKCRVIIKTRPFGKKEISQYMDSSLDRLLKEQGNGKYYEDFANHPIYNDPKSWSIFQDKKAAEIQKELPFLERSACFLLKTFLNRGDINKRTNLDLMKDEMKKIYVEESEYIRHQGLTHFEKVSMTAGSSKLSWGNNTTGNEKLYEFDKILDENTTQGESFQFVAKRMCDRVVGGKNGCVLAYGQTGTGKTYSLLGPEPLIETMEKPETHGIMIRSLDYLCKLNESNNHKNINIEISFMEIYLGKAFDLIEPYTDDDKTNKKIVKIMQADERVVYKNLTKHRVKNVNELIKLLEITSSNRVKAEHNLNSSSSRSHCLVCFHVTTTDRSIGEKKSAKLLFGDLAGSEKAKKSGASGFTLKQATEINSSLSTVRQIFKLLASKSKRLPYRDHIIGSALREFVNHTSEVHLLICVSPHIYNTGETGNTLEFASAVRNLSSQNKSTGFLGRSLMARERSTPRAKRDCFWIEG